VSVRPHIIHQKFLIANQYGVLYAHFNYFRKARLAKSEAACLSPMKERNYWDSYKLEVASCRLQAMSLEAVSHKL